MTATALHNGQSTPSLVDPDAREPRFAGSHELVYSSVAIDMLRKQLVHQVGDDLARAIVAQAGRQAGFNDAQVLLQERDFSRIEDMIAAQYDLLRESGFGAFTVLSLEVDAPAKQAYVRLRCVGSPEAHSHLRLFGRSHVPACWHLVGYSTGWSSAMTGLPLLTVESRCIARGDEHCELETLRYDDFVGPEATFWKRAFESTGRSLAHELAEKLATIERQIATIAEQRNALVELSAPILQVADDLLVLPVIGSVDTDRARVMTEKLLPEIVQRKARGVILDVTGAATLDTATTAALLTLANAARLLGTHIVLTGISPMVAQGLVADGVDLSGVTTRRTLQDGIRTFEARLLARVRARS